MAVVERSSARVVGEGRKGQDSSAAWTGTVRLKLELAPCYLAHSMRVLVNCQSVSAQKTGVGHYTEQLVSHLDALGTCDFTRFPTQSWRRWEHRLHGCYKFARAVIRTRSEEHTSELQSHSFIS